MKSIIALLGLLLSMNSFASCPNQALESIGFNIESKNFKSNTEKVLNWLESDEQKFEDDIETRFFSTQLGEYVLFNSYDHIDTDRGEMFGDVVVMRHLFTNEIVEVRWYENGQKKISFNKYAQRCAAELIPLAVNALF